MNYVSRRTAILVVEVGSTSLLMLTVVLPFLLLFLIISFDFTNCYYQAESQQRLLDDAVMRGVKFLPNREAAHYSIQQHLELGGLNESGLQISATNNAISVQYINRIESLFARFFGLRIEWPVRTVASARTQPVDAIIVLSGSPNLSYPTQTGHSSLGLSSKRERPAKLFAWLAGNDQLHGIDPLVATQQCFSPYFRGIKQTVLAAYEYFAAFSDNRVAVAVAPGWEYGALITKLSSGELSLWEGPFAFLKWPPWLSREQASVQFLEKRAGLIRSSDCAQVAACADSQSPYRFPRSDVDGLVVGAPQLPDCAIRADRIMHQPSLSEALWSIALPSDWGHNSSDLLEQAGQLLLGAGSLGSRGGLVNSVVKLLLVVGGELPQAGGKRLPALAVRQSYIAALEMLAEQARVTNSELRIVYLLLVQADQRESQDFTYGLNDWREIIHRWQPQADQVGMSVALLVANSVDELRNLALTGALLDQRTVVLSH